MMTAPYRARGKSSLTWEAARQKCRFLTKTGSKVPFWQVFAGLHPLYGRAGPLTPKNIHGVTPGPGVREHGGGWPPEADVVCEMSVKAIIVLTDPSSTVTGTCVEGLEGTYARLSIGGHICTWVGHRYVTCGRSTAGGGTADVLGHSTFSMQKCPQRFARQIFRRLRRAEDRWRLPAQKIFLTGGARQNGP